tara:strand:- start:216 stop:479 length:264 start_codon:yes stop_codon:yes gene_type:complete
MNKIINLFYSLIMILFFFNIFNYYFSDKNIKKTYINRLDINKILENKILNLPVLNNDTNNVIEFNSTFNEEIKKNEKRSFWDLLKSK